MRIGLVCPYDWTVPGGVRNHIEHLAGELRGLGHEVRILAPTSRSPDDPAVVSLGRSVPVRYNGSVARIGLGPATLCRLRRGLGGLDLVHAHEPLAPSAGLAAALLSRAPVVGTFHATLPGSRALAAAAPVLRPVYRGLAGRIAVSTSARQTWQRRFGGHLLVIPNGVAAEFFADPEPMPGWRDGSPTILFVGRLEPRKGLGVLLRAYLRLKPAVPRLRLLVVGPDDRRARERLVGAIPPRLRADVIFVGRVPQSDLPGYYASAEVLCAPSLGGESFGIVLAEAMAVGLPVVCSDIPGYRDLVRDEVDGLLVPPGDAATLATTLGLLLDNPARRTALGAAARATARRYAWSQVAGAVLAVYERVLSRAA